MSNPKVRIIPVLEDVVRERKRQDQKWGVLEDYEPIEWVSLLSEELGEAANEANRMHFDNLLPTQYEVYLDHFREEIIQVAALAVAIAQSIDTYRKQESNV